MGFNSGFKGLTFTAGPLQLAVIGQNLEQIYWKQGKRAYFA
jgi:hypothetical protein